MNRRIAVITMAAMLAPVASLHAQATDPPLAATPPMGWNSWNKFGCEVNEDVVRRAADAMVASGMKDAGYRYVVIDDCWQMSRDAQGNVVADATRFPSGMKALADYVHSKGLKFGLYSDAGDYTCGKRPGTRGREYQDAARYAEWGVDFLKYDFCFADTRNTLEAYELMARAIKATGRPIFLAICEWGKTKSWLWAPGIGQSWRTTYDIQDYWQQDEKHTRPGLGVMDILDQQVGLEAYSGPGGWNDPDMLEVGNGGMTDGEYRAHFSLWAMLAAPLIAGNDLANMDEKTKAILLNREIVAIDQDPLGKQASRVVKRGDMEVWARPLADGGRAVLFLNRGTTAGQVSVDWTTLGYPAQLKASVRDLWSHKAIPQARGSIGATVPPHDVVVYRIKP